ncbi:MAG: hypothetical protein JJ881_17365, partial [Alphaproteobacteria bacterium]|nr:hypothetical protein [Alphaproteobacteria bacterium]
FCLRTLLPTLDLGAGGLCASIVDRITVATYSGSDIVFRDFRPSIASRISILRPAHRPASQLALAFHDLLCGAMRNLETTDNVADMQLPPGIGG